MFFVIFTVFISYFTFFVDLKIYHIRHVVKVSVSGYRDRQFGLFSAMSSVEEIALKNQRIFYLCSIFFYLIHLWFRSLMDILIV